MPAPAWLPPLNSHEDYVIATRFEEAQDVLDMIDDRVPEPEMGWYKVCFHVHVSVRFFDEQNRKDSQTFNINKETGGFPGLVLDHTVVTDFPEVGEDPRIYYELCSVNILSELNIPFQLYPNRFLGNNEVETLGEYSLMNRILLVVSSASCYKSKIIPGRWCIFKHVIVSDDEYKAWTSWYTEKSRADPRFKDDYSQSIRRPRTDEEIWHEEMAKFKAAAASSIQTLELVKIENLDSTSNCSVCLEVLSRESEGIRLPCFHGFHRDCIVKWLQESHMCPLCRFTLPTTVEE